MTLTAKFRAQTLGILVFSLFPLALAAQTEASPEDTAIPPPPVVVWEPEEDNSIEDDGKRLELKDPDDLSSFSVLQEAADKHRFIFTGEDHRVETLNTVLETKMMRYLNSRGYNYYFIEAGKATEELVNRYIVEGDTSVKRMLRNYFNPNFFRMFTWLKETNEGLSAEKKIHAVGLDVERNVPLALRLLKNMLPETQAPDSLELFVESLRILTGIHEAKGSEANKLPPDIEEMFDFSNYRYTNDFEDPDENRYFYFSAYKSVLELTREFRRKEQEFRLYLGKDFEEFDRYIKELENWEVWIKYEDDNMPQSWVYRELYMESNFKQFLKDYPGAKGFGQFGRCHVTRITKVGDCGFAFFSSFNKRLITKIPELKDSIVSIGVFYPGLENGEDFFDNGNIVDIMNKSPEGQATLYLGIGAYAEPDLANKFTYVIVAKGEKAGTIRKKSEAGRGSDADVDDGVGFYFNSYRHLYDLKGLNDKVHSNYSNSSFWYEFGYQVKINRVFAGFDYAFLPEQNFSLGDSISQSFKGYHFGYQFGGDVIRNRHIEFIPTLGLGFQQMTYSEEQATNTSLLGSKVRTQYRNPAFVIDIRTQLGWQGKWLSVYGMAGYRLDFSNAKWKVGKDEVGDSPDTRWSGLMLGAGIRISAPMD